MHIPELIDFYSSDAVHIIFDREGEFGLISEPGHCAPSGRNWNLLADHQEKLISWLVEKELHRLRYPHGLPKTMDMPPVPW